ncbi:ral-GDS-related protein-like [Lepus europaeus]|uniref:ral-GDS-related protein-like n=1 Tax=Lepus europaeus TaxID=9983 RepID=UPI002B45D3AA|nr:ral-GDS-related protein-like [Lepus europaeus]XP_062055994.1 ral-GDS-related protein-like [Lepus europaeus]
MRRDWLTLPVSDHEHKFAAHHTHISSGSASNECGSTLEISNDSHEELIFSGNGQLPSLHCCSQLLASLGGYSFGGVSTLHLAEVCPLRSLQPGTKAKLEESLVPASPGRTIAYLSILLCSYGDFSTVPYFLDQIFHSNMASFLGRCRDLYEAELHGHTSLPLLKMKVGCKPVSLPGGDLGTQVYFLYALPGHAQRPEATADAPALRAGPPPFRALALEPAAAPLAQPGPAPEPGPASPRGLPPCAQSAPGPAPQASSGWAGPAEELPGAEMVDITAFSPRMMAEQLTLLDAELFQKVVPFHCLGSVWTKSSKRGKEHLASTVHATVQQFNCVTNCVVTTCLGDPSRKATDRARVVEHWIKVAKECQTLRNVSSAHAILTALQTSPICRLQETWGEVSRKSCKKFERLCEKDNGLSRDRLTKKGAFKLAAREQNPQRAQMRLRKQQKGVVPFLGTYLKYLVMLDTVMGDSVHQADFSFEKLNKEIKVLQEIQLLQVAASNYYFKRDEEFGVWFRSVEYLTEKESYALSRQLEPSAKRPAAASRP